MLCLTFLVALLCFFLQGGGEDADVAAPAAAAGTAAAAAPGTADAAGPGRPGKQKKGKGRKKQQLSQQDMQTLD